MAASVHSERHDANTPRALLALEELGVLAPEEVDDAIEQIAVERPE